MPLLNFEPGAGVQLFVRTDHGYGPHVAGSMFCFTLAKFPQPTASQLVMTQLLNAVVVQEISRQLPADLGEAPLGPSCQTMESVLGLPPHPNASAWWNTYQCAGYFFTLLPLGAGTNTARLQCLDGATVVFDHSYPL